MFKPFYRFHKTVNNKRFITFKKFIIVAEFGDYLISELSINIRKMQTRLKCRI